MSQALSGDPAITPELVTEHGIRDNEYQLALDTLGRVPTWTELGVLSVMWSEHCSYKSSRVHLRTLPTEGPTVLIGPGENAGAVDLGDGLAAVFKMESHNHPSFIEPYQGAATGVGGILRDVFTMGARPVANLNSLRFGSLDLPKTRQLIPGVVAGIGGYGNCMGIPTVGGETRFHESYNGNCLVNAFTVGVCQADRIFLGTAAGVGNPILYVGAGTGRDGIHGATMASEEFDADSEEKRPTVQVGDPFMEKLLLEACLELMAHDCIVGIQDMGAAGLTSSSVEMAGRGGSGIVMDLDQVPMREQGMTPYEILLSESQERMLLVVKEGTQEQVKRIFEKWDLHAAVVGRVTDDGMWRCRWHGQEVAAMPVPLLTDAAPCYDRPQKRPDDLAARQELPLVAEPPDLGEVLLSLMAHPDVCDKHWIFRQYDHEVGTDTVIKPGADGALVRVKGTQKFLGLSADCNGRHVYLDPASGTAGQVAECARNLACVGATPLGLTDCLNFGNPEKPEIMWQFAQSIVGMGEACRALSVPVVSGNVSLYNESSVGDVPTAVHPTPGLAMVGLYEGPVPKLHPTLPEPGLKIALLGELGGHLGGSLYLYAWHGLERGMPPQVDFEAEQALHDALRAVVSSGKAPWVHDLSDGGLAVALAEGVLGGVGASIKLPAGEGRLDARIFGEDHGRALIAFKEEDEAAIRSAVGSVPLTILGHSGGDALSIDEVTTVPIAELKQAWAATLPEIFS